MGSVARSGTSPQSRQEVLEIRWGRRLEGQLAVVGGMLAAQPVGVQRLAPERDRPQRVGAVDVPLLPHQRMAAQSRLDPDLVAPPGSQPHLDQ